MPEDNLYLYNYTNVGADLTPVGDLANYNYVNVGATLTATGDVSPYNYVYLFTRGGTESIVFDDDTFFGGKTVLKFDSDSLNFYVGVRGARDFAKRETESFVVSEFAHRDDIPTGRTSVVITSHRTYAAASISNPPVVDAYSRVIDLTTASTTLYARLYAANLANADLIGLTITFDIGTPGNLVESAPCTVSAGVVTATFDPLPPGTYYARFTATAGDTTTTSYPTEAITLTVT